MDGIGGAIEKSCGLDGCWGLTGLTGSTGAGAGSGAGSWSRSERPASLNESKSLSKSSIELKSSLDSGKKEEDDCAVIAAVEEASLSCSALCWVWEAFSVSKSLSASLISSSNPKLLDIDDAACCCTLGSWIVS